MKKVFLALMACLLIATAANAQDVKFYAGARLYSPNTINMFNGLNSWTNSLFVGFENNNLRFEIYPGFYYNTSESETDPNKTESKTTFFGLGGNVYYDFEEAGFITPFVGAGVSYGKYSTESKTNGVKQNGNTYKDSGYTLNAQGGVSLSLSEAWNFDVALDLGYRGSERKYSVSGSKTDSKGTNIGLDMKIRYAF